MAFWFHTRAPTFRKVGLCGRRLFTSTSLRHLPRLRLNKSGAEVLESDTVPIHHGFGRQIIFFSVLSSTVFAAAAIKTEDETKTWTQQLTQPSLTWPFVQQTTMTRAEIHNLRKIKLGEILSGWLTRLRIATHDYPLEVQRWICGAYVAVAQPILDAGDGKRLCWCICGLNVAVFLAWQLPGLRPAMSRLFQHYPLNGKSYTLISSVFSHRGLFHLAFNCIALTSFGQAAYRCLQRRQDQSGLPEANGAWHLLAFYVAAGAFASLASHMATNFITVPRLLAAISQMGNKSAMSTSGHFRTSSKVAAEYGILPSLGASGAVYACVTLTALELPETAISLIFPPTYPIPIQWGVGCMIGIDLLGAFLGWRMFDHYAHLGGAAFGGLYYLYGPYVWDTIKKSLDSRNVS